MRERQTIKNETIYIDRRDRFRNIFNRDHYPADPNFDRNDETMPALPRNDRWRRGRL